MTPSSEILELGNLFIIVGLPVTGSLIAFLSYLRGHFSHLSEVNKTKEKEANQNREMYIKMVVQNTMDVQIKEIHDMFAELSKRIDGLYALLKK